ncbi:MAG: C1 family peptidase [Syntrophales bacterium]|nr:C1 family peptidase [Syntrophales bacterium]
MERNLKLVLSILAVLLIPCLLQATLVFGAEHELSKIRSAISEKKADWVAGETSISKLPPAARKKRVGLIKPLRSQEELADVEKEQASLAAIAVPASFDWRSATGTYNGNFVTPIKDQGDCSSCWAFATVAVLESHVLMANSTPGAQLNLSEQTLVSCGHAGDCDGGYLGRASNYITDMGVPKEWCFRYTATNNSCANACSAWTDKAYRIVGWHWVATSNPTVETLKSALVTYGPLVTSIDVYDDFFSYQSGIYSYVSGTYQGDHAVVIVGYNDPGQYFIVKNSWGEGWGEAGYFRVAYSQLTNLVCFGYDTIAFEGYDGGDPPPACTYSLNRTIRYMPAAGGKGSIIISTQSNCAWTAVSNAEWITITAGGAMTGNGRVRYKVAANPHATSRIGTITVAGQTFTVRQKPFKP